MAGDLTPPPPVRYCRYCDSLIVQKEMWGPGAMDMNGATEPARSLGLMWIGPPAAGSTVCDARRFQASDRHEPLPLIPDLTDSTAVADWLEG